MLEEGAGNEVMAEKLTPPRQGARNFCHAAAGPGILQDNGPDQGPAGLSFIFFPPRQAHGPNLKMAGYAVVK
jgi:hypothetical protein